MSLPTIDSRVLAALCEQYGVKRLALFGSELRGNATSQSDVDLLVEFDSQTPGWGMYELEHKLSELFQRRVDLNTPRFLSPSFREEVLQSARNLYVA